MTFKEGCVETDGLRIRYMEAGQGVPLVLLHEAGGLDLTAAHDLLSRHARVVAFEMPEQAPDLTVTMARTIDGLRLDRFNLMGSSLGATTALRLTLQVPARVLALVLESPAAVTLDNRDPTFERRLMDLATPTLVLCGTRDDGAPPAMGRVYKERLPNCHLVFVYDADTPSAANDRKRLPKWWATSSSGAKRSSSVARRR